MLCGGGGDMIGRIVSQVGELVAKQGCRHGLEGKSGGDALIGEWAE